jgi:hypothetical protein
MGDRGTYSTENRSRLSDTIARIVSIDRRFCRMNRYPLKKKEQVNKPAPSK